MVEVIVMANANANANANAMAMAMAMAMAIVMVIVTTTKTRNKTTMISLKVSKGVVVQLLVMEKVKNINKKYQHPRQLFPQNN